jgi:hypothetical protein
MPLFYPKIGVALLAVLEKDKLMLARVLSAAVNGVEAFPVEVEVNSGFGETVIVIVVPIYPHKIANRYLA